MTRVAVGGVGGLVAIGCWAWGLLGEIDLLRREKLGLVARCQESEEGRRRLRSEVEALRGENAHLRAQLQAMRNPTASKS